MKKGVYRHFKGKVYEVLGIGTHSETEKKFVVYKASYGRKKIWVRPIKMFADKVDIGSEKIKRFAESLLQNSSYSSIIHSL
jgi:hypothetical protein